MNVLYTRFSTFPRVRLSQPETRQGASLGPSAEDLSSGDDLDRPLHLLPVPHDGDQGVHLPAGEEVNWKAQ